MWIDSLPGSYRKGTASNSSVMRLIKYAITRKYMCRHYMYIIHPFFKKEYPP